MVCPNFPILKLCGCPNFNQCGWISPKEIFGENTGLYPVKMIVLFSSRTNRLQETYIVGNLSFQKPGTIRRGHETCSNQQLIVKGLTPSKLCRISPKLLTSSEGQKYLYSGYSFKSVSADVQAYNKKWKKMQEFIGDLFRSNEHWPQVPVPWTSGVDIVKKKKKKKSVRGYLFFLALACFFIKILSTYGTMVLCTQQLLVFTWFGHDRVKFYLEFFKEDFLLFKSFRQ